MITPAYHKVPSIAAVQRFLERNGYTPTLSAVGGTLFLEGVRVEWDFKRRNLWTKDSPIAEVQLVFVGDEGSLGGGKFRRKLILFKYTSPGGIADDGTDLSPAQGKALLAKLAEVLTTHREAQRLRAERREREAQSYAAKQIRDAAAASAGDLPHLSYLGGKATVYLDHIPNEDLPAVLRAISAAATR